MNHNYQFKNLLGTVYRKGNLLFDSDDNVYSPVGNRVTIFHLKKSESETIPLESSYNINLIALSPNKSLLIAINENGDAYFFSMISYSLIQKYSFLQSVKFLKFSPDGKFFAIGKRNIIQIYKIPNCTERQFNPLTLIKTYSKAYDDATCLDWTSSKGLLISGSVDSVIRFCSIFYYKNFGGSLSLSSNSSPIIGVYFNKDSLDAISVSSNGALSVWECDTKLQDLIPDEQRNSKQISDEHKMDENLSDNDNEALADDEKDKNSKAPTDLSLISYKRSRKYHYEKPNTTQKGMFAITSTDFNKEHSILVAATNVGMFYIHEMPNFNLIQSLSMSEHPITNICINPSAEWVGVASSMLGQLLVWEWKSETYITKQQSHFNNITQLAYNPDGESVATGGYDGKIKIWNANNGICTVTFKDHTGPITDIKFTGNGTAVLSSSEDGTVRAFDLTRYRNFRTFTATEPTQFSCLGLDKIGEFVCAGSSLSFEICVWSMKTGKLLEILSGHTGPISSLQFDTYLNNIISTSWDKTMKIWDFLGNKTVKESIPLESEALASAIHPGGGVIAVSTLNGHITFWDIKDYQSLGSIDGSYDLEHGRGERDEITAKKSSLSKAFNCLVFSPDGESILASGESKYICAYSYRDKMMLIKKFEICQNKSFDKMEDDTTLNKRKMTEFGNMGLEEFELGHTALDYVENQSHSLAIGLPGVKKSGLDNTSRFFKPEIKVTSIQYSPSGRSFAAATTEGLLIYSLDAASSRRLFDPFMLDTNLTPGKVLETLDSREYGKALMMSLRLNERPLIRQVLESIPTTHVELIVTAFPLLYVRKLLAFIGKEIETSKRLEFYLHWTNLLLFTHGPALKDKELHLKFVPLLNQLQKSIGEKYDSLREICNSNRYYFELARVISQNKKLSPPDPESEELLLTT